MLRMTPFQATAAASPSRPTRFSQPSLHGCPPSILPPAGAESLTPFPTPIPTPTPTPPVLSLKSPSSTAATWTNFSFQIRHSHKIPTTRISQRASQADCPAWAEESPPSLRLPSRAPNQNRHIRPRATPVVPRRTETDEQGSGPRMSPADAVKKAIDILGRGGEGGRGARGRGRGRGFRSRGRGGVGRGRDEDGNFATGLYLGDNADGERLAKRLGEEKMNKLAEAFEEMSWRVLPSPMDDAYLDAEHTNNMIEYEPEYLMGEFTTNPDIDEKPPIPSRDALEKMKPFLMTYEGIQSQEEWEQIIEELMERLPIFKEIIDYYSGPNRVTVKQQQEELERVANTIPENVPASVKRFTDRAALSLQSNPGWGWDKKCQFMDKLAWEVTQQYK